MIAMHPAMPAFQDVLVICPLAWEASLLRRRLRRRAHFVVSGSGTSLIATLERIGRPSSPVILAGLAGALHEEAGVGRAFAIAEVLDGAGRVWKPPWPDPAAPTCPGPSMKVVSVPGVVTRSGDKRALAKATGAMLVDQESAAFAEWATRNTGVWGIIRGVSDGAAEALPKEVESWVDARGRTRVGRVLADLGRRPGMAGELLRLRRRSMKAMAAVADLLGRFIAETTGTSGSSSSADSPAVSP